ncbi:uncharacterized protein LOC129969964 isoform X2 [Argiope bruennichi]|uniref:uncharacterized protein LOC129969964 isoform X2 n=1 Tax=Argiope bruennichi TaxID=94029 RepID=UPI002494EB7C|nr:uncharacterized protein LOC129969964 isoform X2 [Argiope bruennichi]
MAGDNSKELMQIHHAIDFKIENFSNSDEYKKVGASFSHKKTSFNQFFRIEVYPNGISPKYRGYISVKISKFPAQMDLDNTYHSWMLSVVDVNGSDKCRQSFVKENIKGFSYNEVIPDFLMRTFLLNQADELLSKDVLTIRCEMIETDCTSSSEHFALQTSSSYDYLESFVQEEKESSDIKPLAESNTNYAGNFDTHEDTENQKDSVTDNDIMDNPYLRPAKLQRKRRK